MQRRGVVFKRSKIGFACPLGKHYAFAERCPCQPITRAPRPQTEAGQRLARRLRFALAHARNVQAWTQGHSQKLT